MTIISFEGCVGAGKSSLTNYFAYTLKCPKIIETYEINPFIKRFYEGADIKFETELSFLLIHYSQIKEMMRIHTDKTIFCDFSIEKDLVYAEMNLPDKQLRIFEETYNYIIDEVGLPESVIYIDLSLNIIRRRIFQRGRQYEIDMNPKYFKDYNDRVREHFKKYSKTNNYFFNVDDLVLDPENMKLNQIKNTILNIIKI